MARFANSERIEKAVEQLKEVYYVDDNNNRIFFSNIHYEQISLREFQHRFPDKEPSEIIEIIKHNESEGKRFTSLILISCIQDAIDELELVGYILQEQIPMAQEQSINYETFMFTFGKYKGSSIKAVSIADISYVRWAHRQDFLDDTARDVCVYWIGKNE